MQFSFPPSHRSVDFCSSCYRLGLGDARLAFSLGPDLSYCQNSLHKSLYLKEDPIQFLHRLLTRSFDRGSSGSPLGSLLVAPASPQGVRRTLGSAPSRTPCFPSKRSEAERHSFADSTRGRVVSTTHGSNQKCGDHLSCDTPTDLSEKIIHAGSVPTILKNQNLKCKCLLS